MNFSWLPLSDRKTLPTVKVLFKDFEYASGLFYPRTPNRCVDDWLEIDRGAIDVIVLSTHWGEPQMSTIAHEYRHFQQHYISNLPHWFGQSTASCAHDGTYRGWQNMIRNFYRSQAWEMDALLYSLKYARDDYVEAELENVV